MFKRFGCLFMAGIILLACCGCNKSEPEPTEAPKPSVVGQWNVTVDMTETINQMLCAQTGIVNWSHDFSAVLTLTIFDDGTYTLSYDRDHLDSQIDITANVVWQMVVDRAAARTGMSTADASAALQEQGKNRQALTQELNLVSYFDNSVACTGVWKIENDKIYFAETAEAFSDSSAIDMNLTAQELSLTYSDGMDEEGNPLSKTIVFTKVQ